MGQKSSVKRSTDQFKEHLSAETKKNLKAVNRFLMKVINGKETEEVFNPKDGTIVTKQVGAQTRVMAAKTWKEINLNKVVADKKDVQEHKHEHKVTDAIKEVAASRAKEKKAAIAGGGGTLVKFPTNKDKEG